MIRLPLSERLRPEKFEDILGGNKAFLKESWLIKSIENKHPLSILLYGPPGCGKTTFARLYGKAFSGNFIPLNGVDGTTSEIKRIIARKKSLPLITQQTILFVDEIHRLNKSQQDVFLPYLEDGTITLIAATTENPSFVLNNALLSRLRVVVLGPLDESAMVNLFNRYKSREGKFNLDNQALKRLTELSSGDARFFLNCLEDLELLNKRIINLEDITTVLSKKTANYDRSGDGHYQLISALHKSIRGSDPDAALYWVCRMLDSGEDPRYIIRRLIRIASEDIGLSEPKALKIATSAYDAYQILGSPEGELAIAELVVYLALAPKSNSIYKAFKKAMQTAKESNGAPPPKTIINAPNKWMNQQGFGDGYVYDHETKLGFSGQNYFPQEVGRFTFYEPKEIGFEREMSKRVQYFKKLRDKLTSH